MIFVDTSFWYAAHVINDCNHEAARELLTSSHSELVTSDYVVDELLTLLVKRRRRNLAVRVGEDLWSQRLCDLLWTTEEDVETAWSIFVAFKDKAWSFTDCVSYALMKRYQIVEALALDDHFRQFGFVTVLP
jgi:predicted nucleic acid-binding protein